MKSGNKKANSSPNIIELNVHEHLEGTILHISFANIKGYNTAYIYGLATVKKDDGSTKFILLMFDTLKNRVNIQGESENELNLKSGFNMYSKEEE